MNWLPGWNTVAGASLGATICFWATFGLAALNLGVLFLSHYYADRKEYLQAMVQQRVDDATKKELSDARNSASNAQEQAAKLEQRLAQRTLSSSQKGIIRAAIALYKGTNIIILASIGDSEAVAFAEEFAALFKEGGWSVASGDVMQTPLGGSSSVDVEVSVSEADYEARQMPPAAGPLIDAIVACKLAPMGYKTDQLRQGQISLTVGHKPRRDQISPSADK